MSERTSYTPSTPCWIDLSTPDIEAAAEFYGGLFGWEAPEPRTPSRPAATARR
jgi:predicted enzyme related to lactoylglutathione lyase